MRKLFYILIFILPFTAVAQQESYYSLYRYNMNVINPAYAGAEASNMLSLLSRRQWSQMEDAPNTIAFAYSSARENNVGLGLSVVSDRVFIEQQTFAYVDFSYKLSMSDDSNLYLGLKGGETSTSPILQIYLLMLQRQMQHSDSLVGLSPT